MEVVWFLLWAGSTIKKSIAKVKPKIPLFSVFHFHTPALPKEQCVHICVCVALQRMFSQASTLYAPWNGICFGFFPAFPGRGVMPFMPHPTANDGVKRRNWVRLRHDDNVKRRGTGSPILPAQLSRIWKVKFTPLRRCRAGLSQDSTYCGEALA